MASLDTDVTMVPAGEGEGGAGATSSVASTSSSSKKGKKFEIKKWNAVALWAWGMHLTVVLSVKLIKLVQQVRNARLLGEFATMHFISTVSADGSKLVKCAPWRVGVPEVWSLTASFVNEATANLLLCSYSESDGSI
nr:RING-box protein 1A [Ipomoea batatas]